MPKMRTVLALVNNPVTVVFGLDGMDRMGVAPAGMERAATGHHHWMVDANAWDSTRCNMCWVIKITKITFHTIRVGMGERITTTVRSGSDALVFSPHRTHQETPT